MTSSTPAHQPGRRGVLGMGLGAGVGLVTGTAAGYAASRHPQGAPAAGHPSGAGAPGPTSGGGASAPVPFRGVRQAGITTPAQDRMHFVALDVITDDAAQLKQLLTTWTRAAERMTVGAEAAPGGFVGGGPLGVPGDTGEAHGLGASGLTITIGYGPSLFDGRFGLADRRPAGLRDLPPFQGDDLDEKRVGGDLAIQACANDPQVAFHAVRELVRLGFGIVAVRWSQLGFGRTSSTSTSQQTPRNLFGFKDGTNNLKAEEHAELERHLWVQPQDVPGAASWLAGGTYLVARRIRMHIEVWDRSNLQEQEQTFGRTKSAGAPMGSSGEFDAVDLSRRGSDGQPLIPADSHVALAHPSAHGGARMLRRGYNFTDGSDGLGHLDAGLFFVAFVRDVQKQFVPVQRALAKSDRMNEYVEHTGSAVFACPPGLSDGQDWGAQIFG